MDVELFDFILPNDNIALRPASPRDSARMLVVHPDHAEDDILSHDTVAKLSDHLNSEDILVFNDTRVIPARLSGKRGEAKMEITLHKRESPTSWWVFAKPAKKCRVGDILNFDGLDAEVLDLGDAGERLINFKIEDDTMTEALEAHGVMPLPPYIAAQRAVDEKDKSDYQTLFAKKDGAVAAPTAGLHFTTKIMQSLKDKGIRCVNVTLHVGAGTFLPVKVDNTNDHKMHSEIGEISKETANALNKARANGGRIIAVGTTSLRVLESATDDDGTVQPYNDATDIFITPGYRFKAVDILMTNFHLPKSTLFMLVCAFAGMDVMKHAYDTAIDEGYRFYSYGDGSLLFKNVT